MELLLKLIIVGIAFSVLRIHYWEKKLVVRWILILLPPSFLLPLAVYPMRNPLTMIIWIPAFVVLLVSIIVFILRIVLWLTNPSDRILMLRLTRPLLTILVFVFAFSCHAISKDMAIAHAIDFAKEIQRICVSTGSSPTSIDNWYERKGLFGDPNSFSISIYKLEIPYGITYHPSKDKKDFTVYLSIGFNMGVCIEGGEEKELSAHYADEGREYNIPID